MTFAQEQVTQAICDEMGPLMDVHLSETGDMEAADFKPDFARYIAAADSGVLRLFTVRDNGALVGYALFVVDKHMHYSGTLFAAQDILFLLPQYRGKRSSDFIAWCDLHLELEGVKMLTRSVSPKNDYSGLLRHHGYEHSETHFMRRF